MIVVAGDASSDCPPRMVREIFGFTERKAALRQMRYEALQLSDICDSSRVDIQRRKQPSEMGTPLKRRVGRNVPE
ncbi:hypothetical protein [Sinorhizobium meliloti]|uniref:hypothetical protein n=1 Tax=Rhizobium meliloti TaxID=382 RepID=UPI00299D5B08|nr:hypothetical protein [Sinorhizobium meliloti]